MEDFLIDEIQKRYGSEIKDLIVKKASERTILRLAEGPEYNWVFNFGKHRGKTMGEVHDEHPSYLQWLLDNWTAMDVDTRTRIVKFLNFALIEASSDEGIMKSFEKFIDCCSLETRETLNRCLKKF